MCIQIKTIFRCNCPHQNTLLCPHHLYVRKTQEQIDNEGQYADNGFQLRLESALQARKDWTPLSPNGGEDLPYPKWEHCSVYKARHQTEVGEVKSGKELTCANWIQNQESFSKLVRGLCAECVDGHGVQKPAPVKRRFIEEIEVDVQDADTANIVSSEIRPSTPNANSNKGRRISQQTPLRKILSQAKQKVIRHNLGSPGDGDSASRASTPILTAGATSGSQGAPDHSLKANSDSTMKEKGKQLPDVFARLLLGTGSTTKGRGGGADSGPNTPTKRPVSRQTKGVGRGGK